MGEVLMFVIVELFGPWERKLFIGPKKKGCLWKNQTHHIQQILKVEHMFNKNQSNDETPKFLGNESNPEAQSVS